MAAKKATDGRVGEARLKEHLKNEPLFPVYFLYGEETWQTKRYTEMLVQKALGDDDMREFNLTRIDGMTCEPNEIIGAAETLPMMAERRCVVVRNWNVEKAYRDINTLKKDFLPFLENPPEECVLIFRITGKIADFLPKDDRYNVTSPKWTAFREAVSKVGLAVEISPRTESENARDLSRLANRYGVKMDVSVARLLIDRVGNDLARLFHETEKLCAAATDGVVTEELVRSLTAESMEARVYDLSKAITAGRADRVYAILRALAFHREEPLSVLAALSSAFVDFYRVRVALDGALPTAPIATDFKYGKRAFAVDNAVGTVRSLTTAALRRCLDRLAETDGALKSTSIDPWQLLETLSVELMRELRKA
ncbi:MAG: DNA polymerase III subunit delta [Clostridia bacterium]|nr:DNA polymerase III subunit delta [Clostridia bacterium]